MGMVEIPSVASGSPHRMPAPRGHPAAQGATNPRQRDLTMNRTLLTLPFALGITASGALALQDDAGPARRAAAAAQEAAPAELAPMREADLRGLDLWTGAGEERTDLGDLRDLVLDPKTGKISHVIVSSGGVGDLGDTLRALPAGAVKITLDDDGDPAAHVTMSKAEFEGYPEITREDVGKLLQRQRRAVEAGAERSRQAGGAELSVLDRKDMAPFHFSSALADLGVYAPGADEAAGEVGEVMVDWNRKMVSFVTFEHEDRTLVLPFAAVRVHAVNADDVEDEADRVYGVRLPRTLEDLGAAPYLDAEQGFELSNPDFVKRVRAFYGVDALGGAEGGRAMDKVDKAAERIRDGK